jgi:phospholipase C
MSSPFTTNISILNALDSELQLSNSVTPSLASSLWGSLSTDAPASNLATQVVGFNRDIGITDGDTWTFSTAFTLDGIAILLQEQMTGTLLGSTMSQSMSAGNISTGFINTNDSHSIQFSGASGAVYLLSWNLTLEVDLYASIEYTVAVLIPAYRTITPVMQQVTTVVMLMLENRSLDNVLGWLYNDKAPAVVFPDGSAPAFDGIPADASNSYQATSYSPQLGTQSYNTPCRVPAYDPNEPMPNVEKQLYANADGVLPSTHPWALTPGMQGFAADYHEDYISSEGEVMGAYSQTQLPVLYGLAQQFAISDRWFASVPTQTDPNRAFSICGTSLGAEVNSEISNTTYANANTIFNVLGSSGKTWGLYWQMDNPLATGEPLTSYAPYTNYYFPRMLQAANGTTASFQSFLQAATAGTLPNFCYLEPFWGGGVGVAYDQNQWIGIQGNDYHPPAWVGPAEADLNTLYQTLVNSPQWNNMLFIITFDEHGGTWDHVAPSACVPPDGSVGASGFTFNRLGVRVPTLLISPLIAAGTVFRAPSGAVQDFDHTSFLATLCKWAGVDPASSGLGQRTAIAPTFEAVIGTTVRTDKPSFVVPAGYAQQGGGTGAFLGINPSAHSGQQLNIHDLREVTDSTRSAEIFGKKLEGMMAGKPD